MKGIMIFAATAILALGVFACEEQTMQTQETAAIPEKKIEKPTDAEFHAFKAYHHAVYMDTTAKQAGGTNKLLHTVDLPTEGTDPVVTPALDHLYSKAVIDLTEGPVYVEFPDDIEDRYWSIHVTDQEHYTIYDEIHPVGKYALVRTGKDMQVEEGATVIESPGDYPHLFIRIQVKTPEDKPNTLAIQKKIHLTGTSKELTIENPIQFIIDTHDVYPQNERLLASVTDFDKEDYIRVSEYIGQEAPRLSLHGNMGSFGPIDSKEPGSNDPEVRAAAIVGHLGLPVHHAYYVAIFTNCQNEILTGDKTETITVPYRPEGVELFWSITRYSALTRNTLPGKNDIFNAFNTEPDENGNISITFSVEDPKDGTYWIPVNAGEPYYYVTRYYKPDVDNLPETPCEYMAETRYTDQQFEDFIRTEVAHTANYNIERVGWNNFLHVPNVTQHEDKFVVRPNSDTLYSMNFFDVEDGYLVVQLPETDRYMSLMIYELDHYLAEDGVINKETRPIVIVKKGNPVPDIENARVVTVEKTLGALLVRTLLLGAEDLETAQEIQQSIQASKVGTDKGKEPMESPLSAEELDEMRQFFRKRVGTVSWDHMYVPRSKPIKTIDRAQGVYEGNGALPASEARYVSIYTDSEGKKLTAENQYTLTVPADIPVAYFWSVTVYDDDGLLIPNDGRIYSANSQLGEKNEDGSISVTFGNCTSGLKNCIPTGDGYWNFTWRYYGPKGALADNTWEHIKPAVVK